LKEKKTHRAIRRRRASEDRLANGETFEIRDI